jgi:hypothetical protein
MQARIQQELPLLRQRWPAIEYIEAGHWLRIPAYPLPPNWNRKESDVAFQVRVGYPGAPPYGIYVPVGILYNGLKPANYVEPASHPLPFEGKWGVFSWLPNDGSWFPTADPRTGSNLVNWVIGFAQRFREGK